MERHEDSHFIELMCGFRYTNKRHIRLQWLRLNLHFTLREVKKKKC